MLLGENMFSHFRLKYLEYFKIAQEIGKTIRGTEYFFERHSDE